MHLFDLSRIKTLTFRVIFLWLFPPVSCFAHGTVFMKPPENFQPQMEVAGCFCQNNDKVLLLLRNPWKPQGNTWCLPGGKLQPGESARSAVLREVQEETGICIHPRSLRFFKTVYIRFPSGDFTLHLFRAELKEEGKVFLNREESADYKWVTIHEALDLPLIMGAEEYMKMLDMGKMPRKNR